MGNAEHQVEEPRSHVFRRGNPSKKDACADREKDCHGGNSRIDKDIGEISHFDTFINKESDEKRVKDTQDGSLCWGRHAAENPSKDNDGHSQWKNGLFAARHQFLE